MAVSSECAVAAEADFGTAVSDTYCNPDSFVDGTDNLGFVCANGPYQAT